MATIEFINLVLLAITAVAGFGMLETLYEKGMAKSRLYSFDLMLISKYREATRNESGKPGFWYRLFIISATALFILVITELVLELIVKIKNA